MVVLTISNGCRRNTETYFVRLFVARLDRRSPSSGFSRYSVGRSRSARSPRAAAAHDSSPVEETAGGGARGTTYGRYGFGEAERPYEDIVVSCSCCAAAAQAEDGGRCG